MKSNSNFAERLIFDMRYTGFIYLTSHDSREF